MIRGYKNCSTSSLIPAVRRKRSAAPAPSCCRRSAAAGSRCAPSRRSSMRCFPRRGRMPTAVCPHCGLRAPTCRGSPATTSRPCSAAGAWASSTRPGTAGSTAPSPSRCSSAAPTPGRASGRGSSAKPRRWPACGTPTSSRFTTWASTRGGRTSPWSSSRGAAWPRSWRGRRSRPTRRRRCWPRWPRPCRWRTGPGSCTETSSRPTSCSRPRARSRSPISGWRGTSTESRP